MSRLIDADALIKNYIVDEAKDDSEVISRADVNNAPTIDAEPIRHGYWKPYPDCGATRCSACDWSIEEAWWSKYCPNCGAKMDGERKGE